MEKKADNIMIETRNDAHGNYLVAQAGDEGGYKEKMLKNGKIPGLLPAVTQSFDGRRELWYETTGLRSIKDSFKQKAPERKEIAELMNQIERLALRLEEYLLEPDEVVLELSCIFEGEECEYLFLYLPGYGRRVNDGLHRLLEEMMEYMDYENHRAVSFLYLLHARSRQQTCGIFSLHRLCEEIMEAEQAEEQARKADDFLAEMSEPAQEEQKRKDRSGRERSKQEDSERKDSGWKGSGRKGSEWEGLRQKGAAGKIYSLLQKLWEFIKGKTETCKEDWADFGKDGREDFREDGREDFREESEKESRENWEGQSRKDFRENSRENSGGESRRKAAKDIVKYGTDETGNEKYGNTILLQQRETEETVLLSEEEETVLLQGQERCVLECAQEGREDILLNTFPFCIGKEEASCNYVFREAVISRRHAKILREGAQYYLVDTRSLNGTCLNGERLRAGEKKEIRSGDFISFADICFIFTCSKASNGI